MLWFDFCFGSQGRRTCQAVTNIINVFHHTWDCFSFSPTYSKLQVDYCRSRLSTHDNGPAKCRLERWPCGNPAPFLKGNRLESRLELCTNPTRSVFFLDLQTCFNKYAVERPQSIASTSVPTVALRRGIFLDFSISPGSDSPSNQPGLASLSIWCVGIPVYIQ